ncbi:hypothetical protein [Roseobacter sp. MH60115]|uniref:hypothetical protein n=1 Tax=Roseobacter sp. MH60115 TaxID=2785324 RepID=UPI0018A2F027|nr:hypothetical protein [Roseobacter sp. MH60115]
MRTVRFPEELEDLKSWLEGSREQAFRPEREDQRWKEWWCLLQLLYRAGSSRQLAGNIVATWQDDHNKADFCLEMPGGLRSLEITEATIPEERRAIAQARHDASDTTRFAVGRFASGALGDTPERALVDDVIRAIARKANKPYAAGAWLLIYPNSNASLLSLETGTVAALLDSRLPRLVFDRVFVLLGDESVVEIFADGRVSYFVGERHG